MIEMASTTSPTPSNAGPAEPRAVASQLLESLALRSRRIFPVILQNTRVDCGAACLAMVLAHHGHHAPLDEVRTRLGVARDGAHARAIMETARSYGLRGRGLRVEVDQLRLLPAGTILHWEMNHFVVLERATRRGLTVIDPACGRCTIAWKAVETAYTGIALQLEPAETFAQRGRDSSDLGRLARAVATESPHAVRALVLSGMLELCVLLGPIVAGSVLDRVVGRGDAALLWVLAGATLALGAVHALGVLARAHLLLHLRIVLEARATTGFFQHLASLPLRFFQQRHASDVLQRVASLGAIREAVTTNLLSATLDATTVAFAVAALFLICPTLGGVVGLLALLQVLALLLTWRRQRELSTDGFQVDTRAHGRALEMIVGMETLKATGCEEAALLRWTNAFTEGLNVSIARGRLSAAVEAFTSTVRLLSPVVTLLVGAGLVLRGTLGVGSLFAAQALAASALGPLGPLVAATGALAMSRAHVERVDDVLRAAPEQEGSRRSPPRLKGQIELAGVSFRYAERSPLVLDDVRVSLRAGELVAIVGASGSGKSTLAALLLGLHSPSAGVVRFDGHDLGTLDLGGLRRQIGVVTQAPHLFGMSIRENIAFGHPEADQDAIEAAARLAQVHDDIASFPMGYETVLSEGGGAISGGQRQRIALARALVGRPSMLLLDEATSALDGVTEARVRHALAGLGCTRIVVAHRLSTVADADRILVLEAGRIVEEGRHAELVLRGGAYARLVAAQGSATAG